MLFKKNKLTSLWRSVFDMFFFLDRSLEPLTVWTIRAAIGKVKICVMAADWLKSLMQEDCTLTASR